MENGYDFDFLITILMYWIKVEDNPAKLTESDTSNPTMSHNHLNLVLHLILPLLKKVVPDIKCTSSSYSIGSFRQAYER